MPQTSQDRDEWVRGRDCGRVPLLFEPGFAPSWVCALCGRVALDRGALCYPERA